MPLDTRGIVCDIYGICFPDEDEEFITERAARVADAVATLDEREQCLIAKRFPGAGKKTTFAKASKEIVNLGANRNPCDGLSTNRALQIFNKAMRKLGGRRKAIIEGELTAQEFLNPAPKTEPEQVTRGHEISEEMAAIPITDLELSGRSANCLRSAGILTVGSLWECSRGDLLRIKNMGRKSFNEIRRVLEERGIIYR